MFGHHVENCLKSLTIEFSFFSTHWSIFSIGSEYLPFFAVFGFEFQLSIQPFNVFENYYLPDMSFMA